MYPVSTYKQKMKQFLVFLSLLTIFGCKQNQNTASSENEKVTTEPVGSTGNKVVSPAVTFAQSIENAHDKQAWKAKNAVSFDIELSFGGQQRFAAKITSLTNSTKVRIDKEDGSMLLYDGKKVYLSPADANDKGARFDMFTWQYFFAIPFKLTDPGTHWELLDSLQIDSTAYATGKLTFGQNTGDAPDDWYVIYQEPKTGLLHAAAYIVTLGKKKEKAEENPHAIVYKAYKKVDGIPLATKWTFHDWDKENGIGKQIGDATISNIQFSDAKDAFFTQPEDSKLIEKP